MSMHHHHLMPQADVEARVGEWLDELNQGQSMSYPIECLQTSMIAATFGTFQDEHAQIFFETRALPL